MLGLLRKLLELLWPRIPSEKVLNRKDLFDKYEKAYKGISTTHDKPIASTVLDTANYLFDQEDGRVDSIHKNATTLLSSSAFVAALVIAVAGFVIRDRAIGPTSILGIITIASYIVSLGYLCVASISALSVFRGEQGVNRYYLDPTDLVPTACETDAQFSLRLAKKFLEYTVENYKINNKERARISVARECMRNAIIAILLSGILLVVHAGFVDRKPDAAEPKRPAAEAQKKPATENEIEKAPAKQIPTKEKAPAEKPRAPAFEKAAPAPAK